MEANNDNPRKAVMKETLQDTLSEAPVSLLAYFLRLSVNDWLK